MLDGHARDERSFYAQFLQMANLLKPYTSGNRIQHVLTSSTMTGEFWDRAKPLLHRPLLFRVSRDELYSDKNQQHMICLDEQNDRLLTLYDLLAFRMEDIPKQVEFFPLAHRALPSCSLRVSPILTPFG